MVGKETAEEAAEAARALADEARAIRRALDSLSIKDARRRFQMWTITVGTIISIVLSGVLIYTVRAVARAADATLELCEARNTGLRDQRRLWEGLLALPRSPDDPPPHPETVAAFRRLLDESLKLEDCEALVDVERP